MKRVCLTIGMVLGLAGCAQMQNAQVEINPKPALNAVRTENKTFALQSNDLRVKSYIALLNAGKTDAKTIHPTKNPSSALKGALSQQFNSQGFLITPNNKNVVKIDLMEALSNIEDSMLSHDINTSVKIQITAENDRKKFVKTYNGNAVDKGFSNASTEKVESILNTLFEAVLQDIADDPQLNLFINEYF